MEEEYVASYFLRVYEIVNSITGVGAIIKENSVVHNIMRTLSTQFNMKVSVLEDISNLDDLTKYEVYGILTSYKMRMDPENVSRK